MALSKKAGILLKANRICDSWRMWLSLLKALVLQNHSVGFSRFAGYHEEKPLPSTILLKCIFLIWLVLMNLICYWYWLHWVGFRAAASPAAPKAPTPRGGRGSLHAEPRAVWAAEGSALSPARLWVQVCWAVPSVSPGAGWTGGSWMAPWTELLRASTTACGRSWREPPTGWSWLGGSCPR